MRKGVDPGSVLNPGSNPGSDPHSDPGSDPGSNPGSKFRYPRNELRLNRHTLPRNSAGHTLFLFFTSFMRSKSALYHLLCEATCSLGTDKQPGNVTSVVEYSKLVTAQQLGDRTMHIIHIFFSGSCIFHVSNIIVELRKLIQMIT